MKTFLILFTLISLNSFAEKIYTYELTVYSLLELAPLQGIDVTITERNGTIYKFTTNSEGKIIAEFEKKKFKIEVSDPNGIHLNVSSTPFFYKENNCKEEIYLSLTKELEDELIASKLEPEGTELSREDVMTFCSDSLVSSAEFKGGYIQMHTYIMRHRVFPQVCITQNIRGKVYVRFKVSETGEISDIKIVKSLHPDTDKEAIRLISYMPNFTPATCNGVAISSYFQLPINFWID